MLRNYFLKILLLPAILLPGCTIKYYDTNKLINDYTTQGFLDRDHYQVIVKGNPGKNAKGLVAQRETALNNAKEQLESSILGSLADYSFNHQIKTSGIKNINDILNTEEAVKELKKKFRDFLAWGYTAFEYYSEDNSAVIVYRIFRDELIKKVESVKTDIIIKENSYEDNKPD